VCCCSWLLCVAVLDCSLSLSLLFVGVFFRFFLVQLEHLRVSFFPPVGINLSPVCSFFVFVVRSTCFVVHVAGWFLGSVPRFVLFLLLFCLSLRFPGCSLFPKTVIRCVFIVRKCRCLAVGRGRRKILLFLSKKRTQRLNAWGCAFTREWVGHPKPTFCWKTSIFQASDYWAASHAGGVGCRAGKQILLQRLRKDFRGWWMGRITLAATLSCGIGFETTLFEVVGRKEGRHQGAEVCTKTRCLCRIRATIISHISHISAHEGARRGWSMGRCWLCVPWISPWR